ncbi:MAG: dihydrodipicolinate synthase family protein [Planctomycetota bacterium]
MTDLSDPSWRVSLNDGVVIPACPLTLQQDGQWSERYQRALARYYVDAGAGGLAVGVHTTQFAIRSAKHGLYEPVLRAVCQELNRRAAESFVRVAGVCGRSEQAEKEAALAAEMGYHAALLSLADWKHDDESQLLDHCMRIADVMPVIGFYLQPAVGGRVLSYHFWRQLAEVERVVAIKIAAFDRYRTLDVIRAVIDSGRSNIALYTGNDDNIIADLLTPFGDAERPRWIVGGLLGQWAVGTRQAVRTLQSIKKLRVSMHSELSWLRRNAELTEVNAALFDAAHEFAGCVPGINEALRLDGLCPSARCLDSREVLSPGQQADIERVRAAYPDYWDGEFIRANRATWFD